MAYLRTTVFLLLCLFAACAGSGGGANNPPNPVAGAGDSASSSGAEPFSKDRLDPTRKSDASAAVETIYTHLAEDTCVDTEKDESEEWSVQSCVGVGGYSLLVSEGDLRQTVDILAPDKQRFKLEYWSVVSSGFSTVGDKAEWRVIREGGRIRPIALIVRYNVNEDPEDTEKITSYLTVSKITPTGACVTDVVKPVRNANELARKIADTASDKPCLKGGR